MKSSKLCEFYLLIFEHLFTRISGRQLTSLSVHHEMVNHSENLIDPVTKSYTKTIESLKKLTK